ncbi:MULTISPECIES: AEC family transporter [unclassified Thauera]|uniref:AEC family transporter n=1 Tax=unclassified Thauera TaxID=2609274 RepID=UPI0021E17044|nr:AEC family transporter [Thauera sp. Sel9]MCV2219408.1 AEC family transporter [Thauera sp. Sel9]
MDIIFGIILPVFGTLGLGYVAARCGVFDEAANRGLSLFVFNFALPLMLFRAIAQAELPAAMPWGYLLSYYIGAFAVFGLAMLAGRLLFGRRLDEQAVLGLGAGFSNTGMLGIPLVMTAYGPSAALPLFVMIACHSLLMLPPTTALIEAARGGQQSAAATLLKLGKSVLATPIIWGLSCGLAFALSGVPLPGPVDAVAGGLGAAATPCALFALGASLTRYSLGGNLREPLVLVALKTVMLPLLVWLLATQVFDVPPLWVATGVLLAALPAGITPYLFAQRYNVCQSSVASAVFLSTLLSVLTLTVLLFLLRP